MSNPIAPSREVCHTMVEWSSTVFVGGHPSLDFVNTAGGRTKARDGERLMEFTDAVGWACSAAVIDDHEAAELTALADADPPAATRALTELRAQREALHAYLLAAIEGSGTSSAVHRRVEADIIAAYQAARLSDRLDDADAWSIATKDAGMRLIGRRVALAAGALLAGRDRRNIRVCGRCSWMFLDSSPTRRRRWCSMAICGNRSKAQRHHQRSNSN